MSNRASNLHENNRFSQFEAEITRSISFARNKRGRFRDTRVRMHGRDIVRNHNHSVDTITGLSCGKLSRIPTHAYTREREGKGDQSEFSQKRVSGCNHEKSTPSRCYHYCSRRSSRIIECITKRNRILDALNSLQTAACVTV